MQADPVPDEARLELRRIADRWLALPVGDAVRAAPALRGLAQALADETAATLGLLPAVVPDLGPAAVVDQLVVTSYDAAAAGLGDIVGERLAELRRALP